MNQPPPPKDNGNAASPLKVLVIITLAVFATEIILMFLLRQLQISASSTMIILADAILLSAFMIPIAFFFIYRPMNEKINALKKFQASLQESKELFTLMLDSSAEAIYGLDRQGNCSFCNDSCVRLLGYTKKEDLLGRNMHSLIHHTRLNLTSFPVENCRIYRAYMNGESVHLDKDVLWKADGTSFMVEYWSAPIRRGNEIIGAVVNFIDITEREKTIEALRRESLINTSMAQLAQELLQEKSIEEISEQVLETAKRFTSSKYGFVGYINQNTGRFIATTLSNEIQADCRITADNTVFPVFHEFHGFWGKILKEGKSLCTNTPIADSQSSCAPKGHVRIEKLLSVPAMLKHRIVGLVALANPERDYCDNDLQLIAKLADLYALSLQRQFSFASLKTSETRYKDLFEHNPHPMWIFDPETFRFLAVNDTAVRHYGYMREEFLAMTISDIMAPDHGPAPQTSPVASSEAEKRNLYRHLKKNGTEIWVDVTSHALEYMGRKAVFVLANDITDRKSAEEDIKLFSTIINQSNDAIFVINPQTADFLHANEKAYTNLGFSQNELLRKKVYDIAGYLNSMEAWQTYLAQLKRTGYKFFETEQIRKDGSRIPVEINARLIRHNEREYVVSVARDLRERKAAEENLLLEKNKLEAVVSSLGDGLTMQDRNFKVLYQNAVHKELRGDHAGEYCYKAYQGVEDICPGCLLEKCFADGKVQRGETTVKTANGTIYFEVTASPVRNSRGDIIAGIETLRDITERKKLETRILQSQKLQALGTLAGGIAHDFNNILTALIGYAELVKLALPIGEQVYDDQLEVLKACARAGELVRQILTFCRQITHDPRPVQLDILVKEVLKLIRATMPTTIEIKLEIAPESGWVLADPTQLHQLILNLCTNAVHAMNRNGGVLTISLTGMDITKDDTLLLPDMAPGRYIMLEVGDTGHGMDRATQERIFEPYFTTKKQGEGTGLGLSVVHGIVKALHGGIAVCSEINVGTTFRVLLPRRDPPDCPGAENDAPVPTGNEKILFVDDEPTIASMGKAMLGGLGYTVYSSSDSREALRIFRAAPDGFDIIITDATMPHMTGAELTRKILETRPNMPVILCTGYSETVNEEKALEIGARALLIKPLVRKNLATVIREIFDNEYNHK